MNHQHMSNQLFLIMEALTKVLNALILISVYKSINNGHWMTFSWEINLEKELSAMSLLHVKKIWAFSAY